MPPFTLDSKNILLVCWLLSFLFLLPLEKARTSPSSTEAKITGLASYYHGKWIGRKTANGEIYRRHDVTAAHRSLPFGTRVKVTNPRNGKSVIVRINNRGPYIKGRVIDLSIAAAEKIGMVKAGVIPVKVEILSSGVK
jgi:rare lipoprotein A